VTSLLLAVALAAANHELAVHKGKLRTTTIRNDRARFIDLNLPSAQKYNHRT
jgi:hypothetical protein